MHFPTVPLQYCKAIIFAKDVGKGMMLTAQYSRFSPPLPPDTEFIRILFFGFLKI